MNLPTSPRDPRLSAYLAAVEAAMKAAGAASTTIASTRASLEEHLDARLLEHPASDGDAVAALLASLDRPADFAAEISPTATRDFWGTLVLGTALGAAPVGFITGLAVSAADGDGNRVGWLTFVTLASAAGAGGLALRRSPRARAGAWIAIGLFVVLMLLDAIFSK